MGRSLTGKRVFVASPGDVVAERDLVSRVIDEFNASEGFDQGTVFFARGWEQLSGTVDRPQGVINDLVLRDCDHMILILSARWGSPPQVGEGYDSGTEEEFFEALRLLADIDAPMRDIQILFKDSGSLERNDQFKKVQEFRDRLERSKKILFNVFDSDYAFGNFVHRSLRRWSIQGTEPYSKLIELPAPIPFTENLDDETTPDLLSFALRKAEEGLAVQAERLFEAASVDGDPDALEAYAKFMRRAGRYERSRELYESVLSNAEVATGTNQKSALRRATALAGIGVVRRKTGLLEPSVEALREALVEAKASGNVEIQAYVNDNLAHTLRQLGKTEEADVAFRRSHQLRSGTSSDRDVPTMVNAAREALRRGARDQALELASIALQELASNPDAVQFASVKVVQARAKFELGAYAECLKLAAESLETNNQMRNDDGASICESLMAKAHLGLGDIDRARKYANSSFQRNVRSGNRSGEASGYWDLAQIAAAEDEFTEATEHTESALRIARQIANDPLEAAIHKWFERYVDSRAGGRAD